MGSTQPGVWPKVTILCSGVALGVYVPALLVERQLMRRNIPTDVVVLERYYKAPQHQQLAALKTAYHHNFAMARLAHRMTSDVQSSLDEAQIEALLDQWQREDRLDFMVWSGFWMPVLDAYRKLMTPKRLAMRRSLPTGVACRMTALPEPAAMLSSAARFTNLVVPSSRYPGGDAVMSK